MKETDELADVVGGRVPHPVMLVQTILSQCEYQVTPVPPYTKTVTLNFVSS
jgi:hypothetical protein